MRPSRSRTTDFDVCSPANTSIASSCAPNPAAQPRDRSSPTRLPARTPRTVRTGPRWWSCRYHPVMTASSNSPQPRARRSPPPRATAFAARRRPTSSRSSTCIVRLRPVRTLCGRRSSDESDLRLVEAESSQGNHHEQHGHDQQHRARQARGGSDAQEDEADRVDGGPRDGLIEPAAV